MWALAWSVAAGQVARAVMVERDLLTEVVGSITVILVTIIALVASHRRLVAAAYWWARSHLDGTWDAPMVLDEDGNLRVPGMIPGEVVHTHEHPDGGFCAALYGRNGKRRKALSVVR